MQQCAYKKIPRSMGKTSQLLNLRGSLAFLDFHLIPLPTLFKYPMSITTCYLY